jgi:hypothetical protein
MIPIEYHNKRWVVSYFTGQNTFHREVRFNQFENAVLLAKRHNVGVWDDYEKVTIW